MTRFNNLITLFYLLIYIKLTFLIKVEEINRSCPDQPVLISNISELDIGKKLFNNVVLVKTLIENISIENMKRSKKKFEDGNNLWKIDFDEDEKLWNTSKKEYSK